MQLGYDMRGGRGGRRGGGHMEYRGQPAVMGGSSTGDTLRVVVSDIRQPVTEDVMHRVFGMVSTCPRRIRINPSSNPEESVVVAQFDDQGSAQKALENLNNRNIFNDGNKMSITYSSWEPSPVLPAPQSLYGAPNPAYGGMPQQNSGSVYAHAPTPQHQGVYVHPHQQMPMQQMPMQGMPMQSGTYGQMGPSHGMNFQQRSRGRGRGDRSGRGRGGRKGFDPMSTGYQQAPYQRGQSGMQMGSGGVATGFHSQGQTQNIPTVFLSVTVVPETEPLQPIFTLIEAFGGVVTIRRNHNKKEILTVKMASVPEADAVVQHLRKVPFAGGTVSARRFPTYNERTPCTDDGNPNEAETVQYDFTTACHRSPGQRSKCDPSNVLKVTGCAGYSEADVMTYFTAENFFPDRIIKDDEGAFMVYMADTETAVKVLIKCHKSVCGEERSNVLFMEGPKESNGNNDDGNGETNEGA